MLRVTTSGANDMTMTGFIQQKDGNNSGNGAPATGSFRLVMIHLSVYTDGLSNMACKIDVSSQTFFLRLSY